MLAQADQIKKLIVFSPYYPPHLGGVENYADELNKYLSLQGIDIIVFTPRLPQESPEFETKYENVKIVRFPAFEIIPNYPMPKFWSLKYWTMRKNIFSQNFNFVISHTRFFCTSLQALCFAKRKKIKWLHIEHGSSFVRHHNKLVYFYSRLYDFSLGRIILSKSDRVVAVSQAALSFVVKLAPKARCQLIYRGFDHKIIDAVKSNQTLKEKNKDSFLVIYIGRLISGKGVADLIRAMGILKNRKVKCLIIGDGPEKMSLESLAAELGIEENVIFLGYKEHRETLALLKSADVFVNPSYTEGLPTTVIEAALCKIPIIATNVGGTSEIISDQKNGFLIRPKDPQIMAEKINYLLNHAEIRKQLGEKACKSVKVKFSWDNSIAEFTKIFNELYE